MNMPTETGRYTRSNRESERFPVGIRLKAATCCASVMAGVLAMALAGCGPEVVPSRNEYAARPLGARPRVTIAEEGQVDLPPWRVPWSLVILSDGALRDGGFVLSDRDLDHCTRLGSSEAKSLDIFLRVESPETTSPATVEAAIDRLFAAIERHFADTPAVYLLTHRPRRPTTPRSSSGS